MSIKYCGVFTNNNEFKSMGENEELKFKKFVLKHKDEIIKEPLSRKIDLNLGFFLTFLKFSEDTKVICVVGNAKYSIIKNFISLIVDSITKTENYIRLNPNCNMTLENEITTIINTKIDLEEINQDNSIRRDTDKSIDISSIPKDICFGTTTLRKSVNLDKEKEEYLQNLKSKVGSENSKDRTHTQESDNKPTGKRITNMFESSDNNENYKKLASLGRERENQGRTRSFAIKDGKAKPLAVPTNKDKIIEEINRDVSDLKNMTKKNILSTLENKKGLDELLIQSENIKNNAFEYKENSETLKKETNKMLIFWTVMTGLCGLIFIWMLVSIILCGNPISPFCHF